MKFDRQTIATIAVSLLLGALGITGYDLTFHPSQEQTQEELTNTTPLSFTQMAKLKDEKTCTYTFVVQANAIIRKSLGLEKNPNFPSPCGCVADLEIPYYVSSQMVTVKNYTGTESILAAIKMPEGYELTKWVSSKIWFVKKENCKEPLPKDKLELK